jgi:hypothetical protein
MEVVVVGETTPHAAKPQASFSVEGLGRARQDETNHAPNGAADPFDRRTEIVAPGAGGRAARHAEIQGDTDRRTEGESPSTSDPSAALSENGEPRRTLRLSLSHDDVHRSNPQLHDAPGSNTPGFRASDRPAVRPAGAQQQGLFLPPGRQSPAPQSSATNGGAIGAALETRGAKEGGAFIDRALRERVDGDITAFLAAFDAALADDTLENRAGLREATDRLLRAGARTRIELERLEARVPLPARDNGGHSAPTWRPR